MREALIGDPSIQDARLLERQADAAWFELTPAGGVTNFDNEKLSAAIKVKDRRYRLESIALEDKEHS